ncbi:hypothetical protein BN2476_590039 [Paraburkholderia piptadeniae]|uniref:Uncharacterized protein n=1 Tax=Paraburkholderia piptadeniae TaxID=1701573 RepID=A0A1N7SKZ0_9BURK|nr:hypothetical protein BN2476_590039 [Paraburkholderia piptadeniae]
MTRRKEPLTGVAGPTHKILIAEKVNVAVADTKSGKSHEH